MRRTTTGGTLLAILGCGTASFPPVDPTPGEAYDLEITELEVEALPPGARFTDSLEVLMTSSAPAQLYYTLDGEDPLPGEAERYEGPIMLTDTALLRALAVSADGMWSQPVSFLFEREPPPSVIPDVPSALVASLSQLVFIAAPGDERVTKSIRFDSVGTRAVQISAVEIGRLPGAAFDPGAFELLSEWETFALASGESFEVEVGYFTSRTLRSAELRIISDVSSPDDGVVRIPLHGRLFP
jgi:hypothetical protein